MQFRIGCILQFHHQKGKLAFLFPSLEVPKIICEKYAIPLSLNSLVMVQAQRGPITTYYHIM